MTIYYLVEWIRAKEYKHIIKSFAILIVTAIIGVASNLVILATTYDYSKATMRNGVLNLDSSKTNADSSGEDRFTTLVMHFNGALKSQKCFLFWYRIFMVVFLVQMN